MAEYLLEAQHLRKAFEDKTVLQDVSLGVRRGEVVVVVGPSGCGKSTLLRCLNGLESVDKGEILLEGQIISGQKKNLHLIRQRVGMVFQSYDLFPHMDVLGNLLLGPTRALKRPSKEVEAEAMAALARVGLADRAHALPRQLSGGQKQRVALVRAMLMHPEVLLLDEITAALDPEMVREVLGVELKLVSVDAPNRVEYLTSAKVDIILANFTVTSARAEVVDFALPYMKVALGVVSPDSALITTPEQLAGKTLIVSKGTTAETYFAENHPEVRLLKFDTYTEAFNALLDGRGDALSTDNTEVHAWALENPGFTVGIESLGSLDTIAPAVKKGNDTVRAYIDEEIKALAAENFFHADFDATLKDVYGEAVNPDSLVVEDGVTE